MAAAAGLLPEVTTIVSNAVSLHPVVPPLARRKIECFHRPVRVLTRYLDPHWGVEAPDLIAAAIAGWVRLTHQECTNTVCRLASFTYGVGQADVVVARPAQRGHPRMAQERVRAGAAHLLRSDVAMRAMPGIWWPLNGFPQLPAAFRQCARRVPTPRSCCCRGSRTGASSPRASSAHSITSAPMAAGSTTSTSCREYGHLDIFMGKDAARDVFPTHPGRIAKELREGARR